VQAVLDQYWPGTTDLTEIKKDGNPDHPDAAVYSAMFNGEEVLVKSVYWSAELETLTDNYMTFVDYIGEVVSAATFIAPGVENSDTTDKIMVTMSRFAPGVAPQELGPIAPYTWIYNENVVRTEAAWWRDYRARSIEFKSVYPEVYESFVDGSANLIE
jgi:hypothetical protein